MYEYQATVISVWDGDTIKLDVDQGFGNHRIEHIRLDGLDTPELKTQAGKEVRDWLRGVLPPGTLVLLNTVKDRREKYGRYLGTITKLGPQPININEALLLSGMARPYDGGKR